MGFCRFLFSALVLLALQVCQAQEMGLLLRANFAKHRVANPQASNWARHDFRPLASVGYGMFINQQITGAFNFQGSLQYHKKGFLNVKLAEIIMGSAVYKYERNKMHYLTINTLVQRKVLRGKAKIGFGPGLDILLKHNIPESYDNPISHEPIESGQFRNVNMSGTLSFDYFFSETLFLRIGHQFDLVPLMECDSAVIKNMAFMITTGFRFWRKDSEVIEENNMK